MRNSCLKNKFLKIVKLPAFCSIRRLSRKPSAGPGPLPLIEPRTEMSTERPLGSLSPHMFVGWGASPAHQRHPPAVAPGRQEGLPLAPGR